MFTGIKWIWDVKFQLLRQHAHQVMPVTVKAGFINDIFNDVHRLALQRFYMKQKSPLHNPTSHKCSLRHTFPLRSSSKDSNPDSSEVFLLAAHLPFTRLLQGFWFLNLAESIPPAIMPVTDCQGATKLKAPALVSREAKPGGNGAEFQYWGLRCSLRVNVHSGIKAYR